VTAVRLVGPPDASMEFFFPDSQDQVDPLFDLLTEQHSIHRVRQRDDRYAHEVLSPPPYDGILVAKPIVDGMSGAGGKYTVAQRGRLYRQGAPRFFRLGEGSGRLSIMGDCGAFTYVREETPLYGVDEVIDFYEGCQFDRGVSVDHVVFGYEADLDRRVSEVPEEWRRRQELTLSLADEFLAEHRRRRAAFEPYGAAHGWSPTSYRDAVERLQAMGYRHIAIGGMVPLKTPQILEALGAINQIRRPDTRLHLLGITRTGHVNAFLDYGVTSFDSTSPFRQAFKDDKDNYYVLDGSYVAIRVPQVDGNTRLRARVGAGQVDQGVARALEGSCLEALRRFDRFEASVDEVTESLSRYATLIGEKKDRTEQYTRTLEARAWKDCGCDICTKIGIEVVLFRGAERNRRRGFHNLQVFSRRLARDLAGADT
jgi:hypothetical protein